MTQATDRDRLIELLASFGLTPNIAYGVRDDDNHIEDTVTLEANEGGVEGYPYFICRFHFDLEGTFRSVGVCE